jgi:type IV pilus assembly protein PilX
MHRHSSDKLFFATRIKRHFAPVANERGMALVLALIMLTVMSLLGALALTTTENELGISTNFRASQEAFIAADRAVEYAMSNNQIFTVIGQGTLDLNEFNDDIRVGRSQLDTSAANEVEFLSAGSLPPGAESDPTYFEGRYYRVTATGTVDGHPAVSGVEAQFVRMFPKSGM